MKHIKRFENFQSVAVSSMYDTGASGSFNRFKNENPALELEEKIDSKNYNYAYNCTSTNDSEELDYIIDNMREVSVNTFLKNVELEEINNALLYDIKYTKEKLKSDWSVKFFRIKKSGIDAFIMVNSAIEYIFKKNKPIYKTFNNFEHTIV